MRITQMRGWVGIVTLAGILAIGSLACGSAAQGTSIAETQPPAGPTFTPDAQSVVVDVYDPARDPADDLATAVSLAQADHKRILLEVGGEWCGWCHIMDAYYQDHPELLALRNQNYVLVKVNFSEENQNEAFLSQYPEIIGYPHIFVLESDGTFLHSQDTSLLEEGDSYNLDKFTAFLEEYKSTE